MTVVAVDWSGRRAGERRYLWMAEAADGTLLRLECGRTREEVVADLVGPRRGRPAAVGRLRLLLLVARVVPRPRGSPRGGRAVGRRRGRRRALAPRVPTTVLGASGPAAARGRAAPGDGGGDGGGRGHPPEVDVPDRRCRQRRNRLGARLARPGPPARGGLRDLAVRPPASPAGRGGDLPACRSPARW